MNLPPDSPASDAPHPMQVQAWRKLGGSGRSALGIALRHQARRWKREALRTQHPDWPDERIERELARIYTRGNT